MMAGRAMLSTGLVLACVVATVWSAAAPLTCYTCDKQDWATCNATAATTTCPSDQGCSAKIENKGGAIEVTKKCEKMDKCTKEEAKNAGECALGSISTKCSFCCDDANLCNRDYLPYTAEVDEKCHKTKNPCENGGKCKSGECTCSPGFTGNFCERAISSCDSNPCEHGGVCVPDAIDPSSKKTPGKVKTCKTKSMDKTRCQVPDLPGFSCRCLAGYTGDLCQTIVSPCAPNPCLNKGKCSSDGVNFVCQCPSGYYGERCDAYSPCRSNPCLNDGVCSEKQAGGYQCACPAGYVGDTCEKAIPSNPCNPSPCKNGGTCLRGVISYTCKCPTGFKGPNCGIAIPSNPCDPSPCENGGTCLRGVTGYTCKCPIGFKGPNCEIAIVPNPCRPNPCQNGGVCSKTSLGRYVCQCPDGFTGVNCETEVRYPCKPNPCQNGGKCFPSISSDSKYVCKCPIGFKGRHCETAVTNPCKPNPCLNGGICYPKADGAGCKCKNGFTGPRCEVTPGCSTCRLGSPCTRANIAKGNFYHRHCNPSRFVQCDAWGGCFEMDCPAGLVWDQSILGCNWA